MKTAHHVTIDDGVWKQGEVLARAKGMSLSLFFEQLLRAEIQRQQDEKAERTAQQNRRRA
jgi:hypothetical protein